MDFIATEWLNNCRKFDHLGNVRTVISDIKNPYTTSGSITNWTYLADVRNISNMYPYGKSYPAVANYNADDDYRYGFNGMEKEKNFDSDGDVADFGARFLDSEYPIFGSPDPLEKMFPYKSPYIMATNNPIWAIDVEGETTFYVFGTEQLPETSELTGVKLTIDYINSKLSANRGKIDYGFDWSHLNGQFNTVEDRVTAAIELAEYAYKNNKDGETITFIGYSHGGAVAVIAVDIIYKKYKQKSNIITIATPANNLDMKGSFNLKFYNSYDILSWFANRFYGMGNPDNSEGINEMIHFYSQEDGVAGLVYDSYFNSTKVDNYRLNTKDASWNQETDLYNNIKRILSSHTDVLLNSTVFITTIKENKIQRQNSVGNTSNSTNNESKSAATNPTGR